MELVTAAADGSAGKGTAIIDAGGGTSQLAHLLARAPSRQGGLSYARSVTSRGGPP